MADKKTNARLREAWRLINLLKDYASPGTQLRKEAKEWLETPPPEEEDG